MGVAWGTFVPTADFDLVRPVFRLFAEADLLPESAARREALARYYEARDAMSLSLSDPQGSGLRCSELHVHEIGEDGTTERLQLEVHSFPAEP
jgi:hypothetical protein